jgi:hypothetical protein
MSDAKKTRTDMKPTSNAVERRAKLPKWACPHISLNAFPLPYRKSSQDRLWHKVCNSYPLPSRANKTQFRPVRKPMTTILIAVGVSSSLMFFLFFIIPTLPVRESVVRSYDRSTTKPINKDPQFGSSVRQIEVEGSSYSITTNSRN